MSPLLEIHDLWTVVDNVEVLRGVNLSVEEGEVHIILGPNGAGKSSLLHTIMGYPRYRVTRGEILFNGINITNLPMFERSRLGISLMHQIVPTMRSVRTQDLIEAVKNKFGECNLCKEVENILEIDKFLNRPLFQGLSGGERKRLELYLAILPCPKLLMLDEPDSGVDVDSLEKIAAVINYLTEKGVTILLVTHRGDIVERMSKLDKVHVMCSGRIVQTGDLKLAREVLKRGFRDTCR